MKKILIIGQAPPAQKQEMPYDTTMLYEMLGWAGITKEHAQEMFIFEAMTDRFPGFDAKGGHAKPSEEEMRRYYSASLVPKAMESVAILLLGRVAQDNFMHFSVSAITRTFSGRSAYAGIPVYELMHPSRRNHVYIMRDREWITRTFRELDHIYRSQEGGADG